MKTINIETSRFGVITVDQDAVITFPEGILGFEDARRFTLVPQGPENPFVWLQSAERPALAFLLMPPRVAFSDYAPPLPPGIPRAVTLWAMVTIPAGRPHDMTLNLLGPIVIDPIGQRGWQIVLADDRYTTRHRVFPPQPVTVDVTFALAGSAR